MPITCVSFHVVTTTSLTGGLHDIAVDTLMSCVVSFLCVKCRNAPCMAELADTGANNLVDE